MFERNEITLRLLRRMKESSNNSYIILLHEIHTKTKKLNLKTLILLKIFKKFLVYHRC